MLWEIRGVSRNTGIEECRWIDENSGAAAERKARSEDPAFDPLETTELQPKIVRYRQRMLGVGISSAVLACLSLIYVIGWSLADGKKDAPFNVFVVIAWAALPAAWFWHSWYVCPFKPNSPEWQTITHGHEVSRNLWIALVLILATLLRVQLTAN
jgi:hypothetical protein